MEISDMSYIPAMPSPTLPKGHVTVKETYAYKQPGKDNIRSKLYSKDNDVVVQDLALVGSNVWGLVTGGWMDLSEVSFGAKNEYQNKNPEVVLPNDMDLTATAKLAVRTDASEKCTIATQVPAGSFDILALKNDDLVSGKLWAKVLVNGIPGWIDLAKDVTIAIPAIAKLPTVIGYEKADTSSMEKIVYNKDAAMTIKNLYLIGTTVWIENNDSCFVKLNELVVHGVPAEHVNPNTELVQYARGTTTDKVVPYQDASTKSPALTSSIASGSAVVVKALKRGEEGEPALWAKVDVNGVPGWIDLNKIAIEMPAVVSVESMDVYANADDYVKAGKVWHNDMLDVDMLRVKGNAVVGHVIKDGSSIGWVDMSGLTIDGKITAWPNNSTEFAFQVNVITNADVTGYMTATRLGLPYGPVAAGTYKVQALKVGDGHVFAKFSDKLGNIVWIDLAQSGLYLEAMAKAETSLFKDCSTDAEKVAAVAVGDVLKVSGLRIYGSTIWGKATLGTETGWVDMSTTYAVP